jgi:uncharacterized protein YceK
VNFVRCLFGVAIATGAYLLGTLRLGGTLAFTLWTISLVSGGMYDSRGGEPCLRMCDSGSGSGCDEKQRSGHFRQLLCAWRTRRRCNGVIREGKAVPPVVHRGVSHTSRDDTAAASSITAIDLEGSAFVDKANLPYSIITPYLIPSIAEDTGLLIFLAP